MNTQSLYTLLDLEPYVLISSLLPVAWMFYRIFLRDVSDERHENIKNHLRNLLRHFFLFSLWFFIFTLLGKTEGAWVARILPYAGLLTLFWGVVVFVKGCRLIVLQYMFLGSMTHGVPLLIVNIFSLILTLSIVFWILSHILNVQVAPILATSAAFSVILGLAMQDTLGNLFAGLSLQLDKSFEIGDWVEVVSGSQKTIGQVKEISWRSTTILGWTDEMITVPNRMLANAQINNFTSTHKPIYRSQMFRLPYGVNVEVAKDALLNSVKRVGDVKSWPNPACIITETNESWMGFKLVYSIDDYGLQYLVGDQVFTAGIQALSEKGIQTANQVIQIRNMEA